MALRLGLDPPDCTVERFPDGELRPRVGSMRGDDVYLIQSTGPPVGENLVELLLLLDACRRSGAERITAVVPYFGYARQDRRSRSGEAVGARAVADLVTAAGAQHLLVIDPHTPALEAMFAIPVEMVTAVPVLTEAVSTQLSPDAVVVAPDLGAVKLAESVTKRLSRAMATVRKARFSGSSVRAVELVGDVADRPVLIVDDMISTGATIEAAMGILLDRGAVPDLTVAAVHGPLVPRATERLRALPLRRIFVTDSTGPSAHPQPLVDVCPIDALLADAVRRLHHGHRLDDLLLQV